MMRRKDTDGLFVDGSDRMPWVWGNLRSRLARVLCEWSAGDQARMQRVLPALLAGINAANSYTGDADLGPVMHWLWPGKQMEFQVVNGNVKCISPDPVQPSELIGIRGEVILACCNNPEIWKYSVGNTDLVFQNVGLPCTREGLLKLLGKTPRGRT